MKLKALAALALFVAVDAGAAPACDAPKTTTELMECSGEAFEQADARLNASYRRLMSLLDEEGQRKLREAQRAWIAFRDANAAFAGDINRGGTAEGLNILGTRTRMTEERASELDGEVGLRE